MDAQQIIALLKKYEAGTLTPQENGLLESWYVQQASRRRPIADEELRARLDNIESRLLFRNAFHRKFLPLAAAASIALLVAIGVGFYFYGDTIENQNAAAVANDISPGGNKAFLTLDNGRVIKLSEEKEGIITGDQIIYNDGTILQGIELGSGMSGKTYDVVLSTPRGGQYRVTLPDGTKVWLNAASVLRYPTAFTGNSREIEFQGEAYFEVAENKTKPFIVRSQNQEIEVLGTSFNVSNYTDDKISRTVLLEGKVKISALTQTADGVLVKDTRELHPGYEAIRSAGTLQLQKADIQAATAWKTGLFVFNDEPLEDIMRKIARWYDVEVIFQGADRNEHFGGGVSRYDHISTVLRRLESAGNVHFKIKGRRVIVSK